MSLTYRDSDHSYWLDGKQIPGITRMLADLGAYPGSGFFTESSRVRGQQAHLACQLLDKHCPSANTLDDALETLDASGEIQPYLSGYLKFRREMKYRAKEWEQPIHSARLRVGGRLDTWGYMGHGNWLSLLDAKAWQKQGADPKHSAAVQTAAYAIMLSEWLHCDPQDIGRYVLALPGAGKYRVYRCEDPHDFEEVTWMANLWWRWHQHGIFRFAGDPEQLPAIGD